MWRALAEEMKFRAGPPTTESEIADAERALGCALAPALRDLLREANGLWDVYDLEVVFGADAMIRENLLMRQHPDFPALYMPFDSLLFIGRGGNGDLFALPILAGQATDRNVFLWDHEDDSRAAVSASLERYVRGEQWR